MGAAASHPSYRRDGRFAPSPSGPLHLGNLRTALVSWLLARTQEASWRVRIEDLDRDRCRGEHERTQLTDLQALGLDWDGPLLRQSERTAIYRAALEQLKADGLIYPCWCTRAEIRAAASAPHQDPEQGAYPGTCRHLSSSQRRTAERRGRPAAWRLDAGGRSINFAGRLHGSVGGVVDDFVVWRGDDTPAYNLAVVVDDAAQGIGEVVRGEDLLASTPRQLLLGELLALPAPAHAHVPLVLGPDGNRLAKRHGAVTLAERLSAGDSIEAVLGWMAHTLGLAARGEQVTVQALLRDFAIERLDRRPVVLQALPGGALSAGYTVR